MSKKIVDVLSGRSVESNAVASLLFDPTVDQIESNLSEVCGLKSYDSASLDASAMVLMTLVLEVHAPWKIQNIATQSALIPPLLYPKIPTEQLKPRLLR